MAAPVASGSSARQTPAANNGTAVAPRHADPDDGRRHPGRGGRRRQPAQLLALHPSGVAEARHRRPGPDHQAGDDDDEAHDDGDQHGAGERGDGDRVHRPVGVSSSTNPTGASPTRVVAGL
jgi:hypothetical protein